MSIRVYAAYENTLSRTGRDMKSFTKALNAARSLSITNGVAEVREFTSKGVEAFRAAFQDGKWIGHEVEAERP